MPQKTSSEERAALRAKAESYRGLSATSHKLEVMSLSPEVIAGLLDDLDAAEAREKRLREALKHAAACRFPFCEECERLTRALAEPDARGTT